MTGNPHTTPCFRELSGGARQYRKCCHWPLSSALKRVFLVGCTGFGAVIKSGCSPLSADGTKVAAYGSNKSGTAKMFYLRLLAESSAERRFFYRLSAHPAKECMYHDGTRKKISSGILSPALLRNALGQKGPH